MHNNALKNGIMGYGYKGSHVYFLKNQVRCCFHNCQSQDQGQYYPDISLQLNDYSSLHPMLEVREKLVLEVIMVWLKPGDEKEQADEI